MGRARKMCKVCKNKQEDGHRLSYVQNCPDRAVCDVCVKWIIKICYLDVEDKENAQ